MKKTLITAVLTSLIAISGTAIAIKVVQADNRPASERVAQSDQAGQNQDTVQGRRGGCGSAGCSSGAGGCGGGNGGCNGGGSGSDIQANPETINAIKQAVSDYYTQRFRDTDYSVEIQDFGCHQEAYVIKDGNKIMTFSVSGNSITEVRQ